MDPLPFPSTSFPCWGPVLLVFTSQPRFCSLLQSWPPAQGLCNEVYFSVSSQASERRVPRGPSQTTLSRPTPPPTSIVSHTLPRPCVQTSHYGSVTSARARIRCFLFSSPGGRVNYASESINLINSYGAEEAQSNS